MTNFYSLEKDGKTKISPHFQAYEFASTNNTYHPTITYSDDIWINEELVDKLEELFNMLHASYCLISSGFRTSKHDKLVGGNGSGEHTKGNAADVAFVVNGCYVDTRIVSIFAQSIGFRGIARINERYIHLDVRENGNYYGDETKGTQSVTKDFLAYYGFLH